MIATLFHEILYKPFLNVLIFLYQTIAFQDLGIAIILLTLAVRFVLFPLFYKGLKNQTLLMKIQPHIKKIQETHKEDKERQAKELMNLYKTHNVNPFSSIFITLLQLPILIGVYQVFRGGLENISPADVYSFLTSPEHFNTFSFGLIDLAKRSTIVTLLAAGVQYVQVRLSQSKKVVGDQGNNPMASANKYMMFIGPIMTVWILSFMPSAIGIYWFTTSLFSTVQQVIVNKIITKKDGDTNNMGGGQPKELREGTA